MEKSFIQPLLGPSRVGIIQRAREHPVFGLLSATVLCAAALAIRIGFAEYFSVPAIFIFLPAVVISTLFGGLPAGILSVVLSTAASWYFFLPPTWSWTLSADNAVALLVFAFVASVDVALIEIVMRAFARIHTERVRMSVALRAANMGLWSGDAETGARLWSPETYALFGYKPGDDRKVSEIADFVHPDDRDHYRRTMASVLSGPEWTEYDIEYRIVLPDGDVRWVRSRASITRDPDGTPKRLDGGVMDITKLKTTERRLETLLFELQHRFKNIHAVIQALADRTLRGPALQDDMRNAFLERLRALSRANVMLVHQNLLGLRLREVVAEELAVFPEQAEIAGCEIVLRPDAAQSFALIVHELATNAIKHGALSTNAGKVILRGNVDGDGSDRRLHFSWHENGGPPVGDAGREGFGRSLLENLTKGLGEATWSLDPDGLRFELVCLLSRIAVADEVPSRRPAA